MNPDLGAQPTERVLAGKSDRGALDACNLPGRDLQYLGSKIAPFTPSQIHAQEHFGPVLGFGTPRSSLNVEESVGGIHFTCKHASELELGQSDAGIDPGP